MRRITSDPAWAAVGVSALGSVLLPVLALLFWQPGVVSNVFDSDGENDNRTQSQLSADAAASPGGARTAAPAGKTATPDVVDAPRFEVIFEDDFADMSPAWPVLENQFGGSLRYVQGEYLIELVTSPTYGAVSTAIPEVASLGDVRIEADVRLGANPVVFGLSCRALDVGTNYEFLVSSDGAIVIGLRNAGQFERLLAERITTFQQSGGGTYHIAAECLGGAEGVDLILYLDGNKVAEAEDPEGILLEGGVGMFGELVVSPGEVWFDNFEVAVPAD